MKRKRFVKLYGMPYYIRETRRFPWSVWKPATTGDGEIIPFRLLPDGRYDAEWKYAKPND